MRPSPTFRIPVPIREQTLWRDELKLACRWRMPRRLRAKHWH
jgi:hypothetical protein